MEQKGQSFFFRNLILSVPRYIHAAVRVPQSVWDVDSLHSDSAFLIELCSFLYLHHNCRFQRLVDIFCVDYIYKSHRYLLVYSFSSLSYLRALYIKMYVFDIQCVVSLTSLFPNSYWCEREIWDLFGIYFVLNSDLRRLLTDYGFVGHPFRKDFPISGFTEIRYDERMRSIVTGDVRLGQEYRHFNITMPWKYFSSISNSERSNIYF